MAQSILDEMERSNHDLIDVLSWHWVGGTEKNDENP
jgi:hypothetical protein